MKTVEVVGQLRTSIGKKETRQLRAEKNVPCVVYGGNETIHFSATEKDLRDLIYTDEFRKASITVGDKKVEAFIKDMQFHPVTDSLLHVDFQELVEGKKIKTEIPVRFVGSSKGVKVGGTLVAKMRKVKVLAPPSSLKAFINVDVTDLDLGKSIRVRDIPVDEHTQIMTSMSIPIASIDIPRSLRSAQAKAAAEGKK